MEQYFNEEERADFEELLCVISKYHKEIREQTLKCIGIKAVKEVRDMIVSAGLTLTDSIKITGEPEEINTLTRLFRDTERRNRYVIGYLHELTFPITAKYYNKKILNHYEEFNYNEMTLDDFHASTFIILGEVLEDRKTQNIIPVFKRKLPDILRRQERLNNIFSTTFTEYFLKKVTAAEAKLITITDHEPTAEDIAVETGLPVARVKIYLDIIHRSVCSYETLLEDVNNDSKVGPQENHILDVRQTEEDDEYSALYSALDCIPDEISKIILFSRFGLCGYSYTAKEICERFGISFADYRKRYKKAFEIVKGAMSELTGIPSLTA